MAFDELAQRLFGARRAESDAILTDATTGTIHGVALTDSEGGAVTVEITADVTAPEPLEVGGETYFADAGVGVEIPTSESVRAGDEVLVSTYGAGTMRSPVVTAAVGSGDRMAAAVSNAETLAEQAEAVASATGQHFWPDTDGVHVTEVTQEDWSDSTSTNYHSGANVLINSIGQLFRDGLNNLLALLPGTATTYAETFTAAADQTDFVLSHRPTRITSVVVDGITTSVYSVNGYTVTVPFASTGNVVEVTYEYGGTSIAIFDGNGNQPENVVASFGEGGTIIGSEYGQHVEVGQESVRIMGGQSDSQQMARFGSSVTFGSESDPMLVIADNLIHFYRFENELISFYFDDDAAISSTANGMLNITANGGVRFNGAYVEPDSDSASRLFYVGSAIDNSASAYDGRDARLYVMTSGLWCYTPSTSTASGVTHWSLTLPSGTTNLNVLTGTVTRGSGAASIGSSSLKKYGSICVLTLTDVKLSAALASGRNSGTVATIPTDYRPPAVTRVAAAMSDTGNYGNVWFVVGTSGTILLANHCPSSIATSQTASFTVTYIVD